MDIPALITVRSASTRLPQKCWLPFGEHPVLEHVVRRALHYSLKPVLCTTKEPEDDRVAQLAARMGIPCFRGSTRNKLSRWSECCRTLGISAFHSVDADDPFFCGDEVKRSFALLQSGYDMVSPCPSSSSGGATVGYSLLANVIARASEGLPDDADTEMMWFYVDRLPGLRKITLDDPAQHCITARLTLDYEEDYTLLNVVRILAGAYASREEIATLFARNPDLSRINAFRTAEWAKNQQSKAI